MTQIQSYPGLLLNCPILLKLPHLFYPNLLSFVICSAGDIIMPPGPLWTLDKVMWVNALTELYIST